MRLTGKVFDSEEKPWQGAKDLSRCSSGSTIGTPQKGFFGTSPGATSD